MRFHTRIVFTPTGPLHIFHAYLWRVCREVGRYTGGSSTIRFECTLATQTALTARDDRMAVCEDNLRELYALGLEPTEPAILAELGFPPGIGVRYQYGGGELAKHYWRLWKEEQDFGPWPPPYPEGQWCNQEASYWQPGIPVSEHPYTVLMRVAEDLETGRNLIIRGEDLLPETALYTYFAQRILRDRERRGLPLLAYLPRWGLVNDQGLPVAVSSGDYKPGAPGFLCDVLAAGRTGDELFEWMDRRLLVNPLVEGVGFPSDPGELSRFFKREPIALKDWHNFIWAGHRRKQEGGRG